MELESDMLDVNQLKNQYYLLVQKREEETKLLRTAEFNVQTLRRQQLMSEFETSENIKLLKRMVQSAENLHKSSIVSINETSELLVDFNTRSEHVLNDNSLLEREISDASLDDFQKFQDLNEVLSNESMMNMKKETNDKLNEILAAFETEETKYTCIKDEHAQHNKDRMMLAKNLSSFTNVVKKLNFEHNIAKKMESSRFKYLTLSD